MSTRYGNYFTRFSQPFLVKLIYSEKTTKFCKISTLLLSYVVPVKSKVEISQNFVAFSEYMNFIKERPVLNKFLFTDNRRSSVGVGVLGSLIYAVGGYDGNSRQCLASVEVYIPEQDAWKRVADMSARR